MLGRLNASKTPVPSLRTTEGGKQLSLVAKQQSLDIIENCAAILELDCFAPLAMTAEEWHRIHAFNRPEFTGNLSEVLSEV